MGRTEGLATYLRDAAALEASFSPSARQPRLGAARRLPLWAPVSLPGLLRALDLRPAGPQRFEMKAAQRQWPAFPAAQLAAAAVVAAERCFPGYSVGHLACAFDRPAPAAMPLTIVMTEVRASAQRVTGRLEFAQGGIGHGEAAIVLSPDAAGSRAAMPAPAGQPAWFPDGSASVTGLHPSLAWLAPWELRTAPVPAVPAAGRRGASVWSRLAGSGGSRTGLDGTGLDGTGRRALLAYLSEVLPLAAAAAPARDRGRGGLSSNVLSHAITYNAPFDPADWLRATVDTRGAEQGYVHAQATFTTAAGDVAAVVSQAAAIRGARASGRSGKQGIA